MIEKIERFILEHHLLSLATMGERLWCCSMFYAYDPKSISFIVASDETTEHMNNVVQNPHVAGTVALETKTVGKIQGIQFAGEMERCSDGLKSLYFDAFPYARVMNPTLWMIRLDEVKMTDNTLGFGKKVTWKREL
ncbi:MAG: pyridoxamine 5'-phosphate oxidase family protein [Sulfuricurvum sp.]|uniref:pyridoxamine 5'-phosphate oxidase family protein n=1 Tax=Sulfuricurvum sp. TaxID=2025608 RepID=UPI002637DB8B|nr:pyridoxamine 5'-phosphate oxidase family protein [Sulfuricurvum sp.]MDD5160420.1 pyridoxamine 5'-phosphate oxidase family protein [Sulfuricurvum sp.]